MILFRQQERGAGVTSSMFISPFIWSQWGAWLQMSGFFMPVRRTTGSSPCRSVLHSEISALSCQSSGWAGNFAWPEYKSLYSSMIPQFWLKSPSADRDETVPVSRSRSSSSSISILYLLYTSICIWILVHYIIHYFLSIYLHFYK
jgi:hypothetical protein